MFIVVPEVVEKAPPVPEEPLPLLALVDYPKTTTRVHWLYSYYLSWNERPIPFLDQRSPLAFPRWKRRPFIHFTNMYYARWMRSRAHLRPGWTEYAGRLNSLCGDCRKYGKCKEMCSIAIERQKSGVDSGLQLQITQYLGKLGVSEYDDLQHTPRSASVDVSFLYQSLDRRPRLKVNRNPAPLAPVPEQEDEDWEE